VDDTFASLAIFKTLSRLDIPQPLANLLPLMPVLLYNAENTTVVARGHLSPNLNAQEYDGINISCTCMLVNITEVLVPATIVTTHRWKALQSFGGTPFQVVCLCSHLRSFQELPVALEINSLPPTSQHDTIRPDHQSSSQTDDDTDNTDNSESFANLIFNPPDQSEMPTSHNQAEEAEVDAGSAALHDEILGEGPMEWDNIMHSCVLKDPFHVFNMFYISWHHGLHKEFA